MTALVNHVLEWLYPPRCMVCEQLLPIRGSRWVCAEGCRELLSDAPEQEGGKNKAVFLYDDILRTLLYRFKYGEHPEYGEGFAHLMAEKLGADYFDNLQADVLVPVPLHAKREKSRGYNQSVLLARHLGRLYNIPVEEKFIVRTRHTRAQSGLSPGERRQNIAGAFTLYKAKTPAGKHVVLVDDIFTTGATLDACTALLIQNEAEMVSSVTLSAAVL